MKNKFKIVSDFKPIDAQHKAIDELVSGIESGEKFQTVLGVTGSGKTFVAANVIEQTQRPTLVITHNKTLVAQLYNEFKQFFPDSLVEYYVSHFDYYQPESYLPSINKYIEKDSAINDELNKLRLSAISSLTSGRRDVIVVASVSCIFGAGNPYNYKDRILEISVGQKFPMKKFLYALTEAVFSRTDESIFKYGTFVVKGDTVLINAANAQLIYRVIFFGDEIESIETLDHSTKKKLSDMDEVRIYPASIIVKPTNSTGIMEEMERDLDKQIESFKNRNLTLEASRLKSRTEFDIEMIKELGYCSGIENYSRYFDRRKPGDRPFCLLDYFPEDYLIVMDESHATHSQIRAMFGGNLTRKTMLIKHGFRIDSALDARPLNFEEFEEEINQIIFVSATPSKYELERCNGVVTELLIRPTGIQDPPIEVRPMVNCIDDLLEEINTTVLKGGRVLVNVASKISAENLATYLKNLNINCEYIHSEVKTLDREVLIYNLRSGKIDVLIGINLLREGLDLPEVTLVAVLDADKEGFLRDFTSLIQIIGRGARNTDSKTILYGDRITDSMAKVIKESNRRRKIQTAYNKKYNITPTTIKKKIAEAMKKEPKPVPPAKPLTEIEFKNLKTKSNSELKTLSSTVQNQMNQAAKEFDFPTAAKLRDQFLLIKTLIK